VVSEQRRGEVELGCWAAWKLGTALEEVGQKREREQATRGEMGQRWKKKMKKECGPVGKQKRGREGGGPRGFGPKGRG
jgi:hypothetical protein